MLLKIFHCNVNVILIIITSLLKLQALLYIYRVFDWDSGEKSDTIDIFILVVQITKNPHKFRKLQSWARILKDAKVSKPGPAA